MPVKSTEKRSKFRKTQDPKIILFSFDKDNIYLAHIFKVLFFDLYKQLMDDVKLLEDDILPQKNVAAVEPVLPVEAAKFFVLSYFKDGKYIVCVI